MIQLSINHKYPITLNEINASQSIFSLYPHNNNTYVWEGTTNEVELSTPVYLATQKYGNNWRWITKETLHGGDNPSVAMWFSFAFAIIFWIIFLALGLMPFITQYYAIAIQNIAEIIQKGLVWTLGPESPIIFIFHKIASYFTNIIGIITMIAFVWYLTAVWCYVPYFKRYSECEANYMRRFFGGVVVTMFLFFYYGWDAGIAVINSLRNLGSAPFIGPLMGVLANIGDKIYNKLRDPGWYPFIGPAIVSYFELIEEAIPKLVQSVKPIELAENDMKDFLKQLKQEPMNSIINQYHFGKIVDSASYQYMSDQEKYKKMLDRSEKGTTRFIQWFLVSLTSMFGGFLNILKAVCSDKNIKELQDKINELRNDPKMDPKTKETLLNNFQTQIYIAKHFPKIDPQCLINTIETGTLAGVNTIFWGLVVFIIFMFVKPPSF